MPADKKQKLAIFLQSFLSRDESSLSDLASYRGRVNTTLHVFPTYFPSQHSSPRLSAQKMTWTTTASYPFRPCCAMCLTSYSPSWNATGTPVYLCGPFIARFCTPSSAVTHQPFRRQGSGRRCSGPPDCAFGSHGPVLEQAAASIGAVK
jgi:hypothetical protein